MKTQTTIILINLVVFIVFVIMHQINKRVFKSILLIPLANRFIKVDKYETSNKKLLYALFYLLTFLSIVLTIQFYDLEIHNPFQDESTDVKKNPAQVIYLSLALGSFFFLKTSIEYITLYILDVVDKFKSYITYKFLLASYCLVLFVPLIFFIEYNDFNITIPFNEAITSLFIIYIAGQLIHILGNDKSTMNNLPYIILYLCIFEFGTYFFIYQLVND